MDFTYTTASRERTGITQRTGIMKKGVSLIPWVNVLILSIVISAPASKLQAASYEVGPFYSSSLIRYEDSGNIEQNPDQVTVIKGADRESRGVLWFELPPMEETIVSAQWRLVPAVFWVGLFGFSTVSLYDVDGQYDESDTSLERFSDLGTGKRYGQQNIFEADHLKPLSLPLSADAVDDLNAARAGTAPFRVGCTAASGTIQLGLWLILETEAAPEPTELSGLELAGETLTVTIRNIPGGQTVHLRQSTDLVTFEPLSPPLNITGTGSPQTVTIPLGGTPPARLFLRVYEGAYP